MTEADWLKCSDVEEMLHCLWDFLPEMKWEDRKPTLLFCACGELVQHLLPAEYGELLMAMEKWADGLTAQAEIRSIAERAERTVAHLGQDPQTLMFSLGYGDLSLFGYIEGRMLSTAAGTDFDQMQDRVKSIHCDFVRDIFGNPFRTPQPSGAWLQDKAV